MRRPSGTVAAGMLVAAVGATGLGGAPAAATPPAHGRPGPDAHLTQRSTDGHAAREARSAVASHPGRVDASSHDSFTVTDVLVDVDGTRHVRMERTYKGLDVVGGDVVVHQRPNGRVRGASRTLQKPLALRTRATVGKDRATRRARRSARGREVVGGARVRGEPELVVDAVDGRAARLAWRVTTSGTRDDGTPSRLRTYVDARSGRVLDSAEQIQTADGEGHSLYGGTVALTTTRKDSTYQLKDPRRGGSLTGDAHNQTDDCTGSGCSSRAPHDLFTDADNVWGTGEPGNRTSAAVDAQYGTATTWDYYADVHGRTGIAGDAEGSYNRVHYGNDDVNAFWDPSCFCMAYGDGDGARYGPLTSLDVAGHEMTHGVTGATAGLTYQGEPGGLNESTSDIFGSMVEFYAENPEESGNYLIGEQVTTDGAVLRRMDDPASDGSSVGCWSQGVGNLDVHDSSGVGNHFYYLLAEGSGSKTINGVTYDSPTCDGSAVTGIGRAAAERIWYRALAVYMTSGTDYHGARTATLHAARDLYGSGSTKYAAVDAAWAAVDVT